MKKTFAVWMGLGLAAVALTAQAEVRSITEKLPHVSENAPIPVEGCKQLTKYTGNFKPVIPDGATFLSNRVSGYVDDACDLGSTKIGHGSCAPYEFGATIVDGCGTDGSFSITVYDETSPENVQGVNLVELNATCETFYDLPTNSPPMPPGGTNDTGRADCDENEPCDCKGGKQKPTPPAEPGATPTGWTKCPQDDSGCGGCGSHGSPKVSVNLGEMDLRVEDTPIWIPTAVGPALELRLRFENSRLAKATGGFGPGWRCNWESTVTELGGGTNLLRYPLGAEVVFTDDGTGVGRASSALTSTLRKSGGNYYYERDNGWVAEYEPSGTPNEWRLAAIRDAWGNEVAVTYAANGKLAKAEQTTPATGRALFFAWSGDRIVSVETEAGARKTASFAYDNGRLASATDMGGFTWEYVYTNGFLSSVFHGSVTRASIEYSPLPSAWDETNAWMRVTDGGGVSRAYAWEYGVLRKTTTRHGRTKEERFQIRNVPSRGRVVGKGGMQGQLHEYRFNDEGLPLEITNRTEAVTKLGYNGMNRLSAVTNAAGEVREYVYAANGVDLTDVIAEDGTCEAHYEWVADRHVIASESNAAGRVVTYAYNALGQVTSRSDGRTTETRTYDAEGRLTSRARNGITVEENAYDAFGFLAWTRNAAGLETFFTRDGLGRVTGVTTVNGALSSTETTHWECCWPDQKTDARGGTWLYQYNDNGELTWEENPAGLETWYEYGVTGGRTLETNALTWKIHEYTPEGWLKRTEWPKKNGNVHAENFWYDGEGRMVKRQGLSGAYWKTEYDEEGRVTGEFSPTGETLPLWVEEYVQTASNRYDACGRVVWTRDVRGLETTNEYDTAGRLVRQSWSDGTEESRTYNVWGEVLTATDRAGNVTQNEYDALGRRVRTTDAKGNATAWEYDAADRVTAMTNAAGEVWRYAYDAAGHVTNTIAPDGSVETRTYTAAGDLASVEKGGITNAFAYDIMGNRTEAAVNGMVVSQSSFDELGRTIATTNADGVAVTNTWNEWSELVGTAYPGGTSESFVYGDRGMTSATDRLGIATSYERDTLGRVTRTTDGEGHAVAVAYATNGTEQVEGLTDANGNTTRWTYDEWGRKTRKTYADNSTETYAYDPLGRMTNKLDPAHVATTFAYDASGNLTGLQRGKESSFAFGYDALDRRTNMTDAVGTTGWRYDELGRVTGETGPFGTPEVQVAYDANGRMTNVVWGTYEASYAYDALGRITGISAPEGTYAFTYHANGIRRASVAYPNGVAETRTYDALARVTGLAFATGTNEWLSVAYAYDAGDRRTNETWSTGREMAYGYDDAHQLTEVEAARPSDEARYAYDPAGNPIARTELGFETTNAFNNLNQILSGSWTGSTITAVGAVNYPAGTVTVSGASGTIYADKTFDAAGVPVHFGVNYLTNVFTDLFGRSVTNATSVTITNRAYVHDANGNLTGDGVFSYAYDAANQLTNVVRLADGARLLFARYDALGRRVEATRADGSVERYVYFPGSFLVLAVLDGANAVKEVYTRGPDLSGSLDGAGGIGGILACTYDSGATYCSHADIMGNVIALTDASGTVAATFRYTPFGQLSARTGSVLPRYLFSSKEFDRAANLYYYGYRYYAPRLGRWMTRDPMGEEASLDLFSFAVNSPFNRYDALGLRTHGGSAPGYERMRERKRQQERQQKKNPCCDKVPYNPETHCCENNLPVEKRTIWVCRRRLGSANSIIPILGFISHSFVTCRNPYLRGTIGYGKQPKHCLYILLGPGKITEEKEDSIDPRYCEMKFVCPADWIRMCQTGSTQMWYSGFIPSLNCHGWANCKSK